MASSSAAILSEVAALLGPAGFSDAPDDLAPWLTDWRGRSTGRAIGLASPRSAEEVSALVRLAARHGVPLVPQGGNTSMVGGATPGGDGRSLIASLRRMDRIRTTSASDAAITVEAGVSLQRVHEAAERAGLRFPLSLAAKGSATVGGLVSTNAGGTQVLRFGPMRAQVLGLEAVLPDGSLLGMLAPLRKDNRGYDLKQLLIGAEGTLGIVTAATLRLVPPVARATAWLAFDDPEAALGCLRSLEEASGGAVESFELIPAVALELVLRHLPNTRAPLPGDHAWHILLEIGLSQSSDDPAAFLARAVEACVGIVDGAVAQNEAQAAAFWRIREGVPEAERKDGLAAKHDVAVPVSLMPRFILDATRAVEERFTGTRVIAFGHLGDGNVHFNVRAPEGADSRTWLLAEGDAITRFVHDLVLARGGTLSAEHGIGQFKLAEFARLADPARLAALRAIKAALDPAGLMNPGKLLPLASAAPRP